MLLFIAVLRHAVEAHTMPSDMPAAFPLRLRAKDMLADLPQRFQRHVFAAIHIFDILYANIATPRRETMPGC